MDNNETNKMAFDKDSPVGTFIVAGAVCLVCALLVSATAVFLKPRQDANVLNDRKMNILLATGDFKKEDLNTTSINEIFKSQIEDRIIDLATGDDVSEEYWDGAESKSERREKIAAYDQFKASLTEKKLPKKVDIAGIKKKEKHSHVYLYTSRSGEKKYIFPIRGYGLWSTLKGFIALKEDLRSIAGLTYYEHKETPGLGGEVDNPNWKAQWTEGKCLCDENGNIRISVVTKQADPQYKVDALSGATITSRGVENMIAFWMGQEGFGPYIEKLRAAKAKEANKKSASESGEQPNG